MRRTWIGLTIVVLTVTLVATPGLAAGGGGKGSTSFNLVGTVVEYRCDDPGYITVDKSWPADGTVTVQTDEYTIYRECTGTQGGGLPSRCEALVTLQTVRIMGTVDSETIYATRVILYLED